LELITGKIYNDVITKPTIPNAVTLYEKLSTISIRELPDYHVDVDTHFYEVRAKQKLNINVEYKEGAAGLGYYGTYDQSKDKIDLYTHDEGTFVHELTHAIHKRIDGQLKGGRDAQQETIAELTACVVCSLYGIDTKKYYRKHR
jgi:hypothetical protein